MLIGIYGISGVGKSHLLKTLKGGSLKEIFSFFEGADEIGALLDGGLSSFDQLDEAEKANLRKRAITNVQEKCVKQAKVGIIVGHFMLWSQDAMLPVAVHTKEDLEAFSHILYLDIDPEIIAQRRHQDVTRERGALNVENLRKWQGAEKSELRKACYDNGILFTCIGGSNDNPDHLSILLRSCHNYTEEWNLKKAESRLHHIMAQQTQPVKTMLVMDADRTLSPSDTGYLFWKHEGFEGSASPLKSIFASDLGYSHAAFRQAAALYHERYNADALNDVCQEVASKIALYPQMHALLDRAREEKEIGVVVVTCGLQSVWEKILNAHGFTHVPVIGGGRLDDLVVDGKIKETVVTVIRQQYGARVIAFGDSVLDLAMLGRADEAIVVVGSKDQRSTRMERDLLLAMHDGQVRAKQAVLSAGAPPRLDIQMLPMVPLDDPEFVIRMLREHSLPKQLHFIDKTDSGAGKLLMTPTRDAALSGPVLREAHQHVGWYLATDVLPRVLGLEEHNITHVQGHTTQGHRIRHESSTLIVALMRGGEPMAFGVNKALPKAGFLHAKPPQDITAAHVKDISTVILVDSVVNSGKSMIEFWERLEELGCTATVVMIAGVVQSGAIAALRSAVGNLRNSDLTLIALRQSENKYTGRGGTDTGNRLFNTLALE